MNSLIRPLLFLCLPAIPASVAVAAPLSNVIAGDARWALNLDLGAVRETSIGKELLASLTAAQPGFANGQIKIDFNKVFATVTSFTAYGTNFTPDPQAIDGALIVQGTPEMRKIVDGLIAETLVSQPERLTEIKDLPFEAYSINHDVIVGLPKEGIVLMSKSRSSLLRAYDVILGKTPSLHQSSSTLKELLPRDSGAFLVAASIVPPEALAGSNAPQARILQMTNAGSVAIGEASKQIYVHLKLVATTDDMADKLTKIVQGMAAMVSLAETSDKQLEEFVKSVSTERHDKTVNVSLAYSSERLAQMIATAQSGSHPSPTQKKSESDSKTITTWSADQQLGGGGPLGADMLVTRTIPDVKLSTGTVVSLSVQRAEGQIGPGDLGRIDYVEIVPQQPNATPLHFEAERMIMSGYHAVAADYASGGKLAVLNNRYGSVRFEFPGADGTYTVKVRYLDDPNGSATFTLKTQEPDPAAHD